MRTLQDLCDELDLAVQTDVVGDVNSPDAMRLFAVGCEAEDGVGGRGFVVTPWFSSTASLAAYCEAHYDQIIEKGAPEC